LTLYYTAQKNRRTPSYYAFGMYGVRIPRQSEYEIDAYVTMIGVEHESEKAREAEQRLKNP